jgi:hypothetical protein
MKKKRLIEILYEHTDTPYHGDQILMGLNVMHKYYGDEKLLRGSVTDLVFAMKAKELCKKGLTDDDARLLRDARWDVNEYGVMIHSV